MSSLPLFLVNAITINFILVINYFQIHVLSKILKFPVSILVLGIEYLPIINAFVLVEHMMMVLIISVNNATILGRILFCLNI